VALAVFCLTPSNVILFDEPSNHLDVQSIAALVSALDEYEGAVVVVSHDRAFCEALRCTHVAYVAGGSVTLEERELRASDFSEDDKGVANVDAQAKAQAETEADREERKAMAQLDRKAQKERLAAPKKLKQVEGKIADAEAELEALSAQMLECGSDAQRAVELSEQQAQVQSRVDELYEEWERLEELAAEAV